MIYFIIKFDCCCNKPLQLQSKLPSYRNSQTSMVTRCSNCFKNTGIFLIAEPQARITHKMDLSTSDYEYTVESLRERVESLSQDKYDKDYEIERLKLKLNRSCTLMEVCL